VISLYYLIFDQKDRFRGYTRDKTVSDNFNRQRDGKFTIKEVSAKFFNDMALQKLKSANVEVEDYYGVPILHDEYDHAFVETSRMFVDIYRTITSISPKIECLELDEHEHRVLYAFKRILENIMESMGIYMRRRDDFEDVFSAAKIVSKALGLKGK
jgi:hypothetical protein